MFTLPVTAPQKGDKYFITRTHGGYSPCISIPGSPINLDALPNCVGYAVGMFNKIAERPDFPYLANSDAENQGDIAISQGLSVVQTPVLGGAMVWRKGRKWNPKDGAGHVSIVIGVNPDGSCVTADSAYRSTLFYTKVRSGANYGQSDAYAFCGCVVNPGAMYSNKIPVTTLKHGSKGEGVKWLQAALQACGHSCGESGIDGHFGDLTEKALKAFQVRWGLIPDGACGRLTKAVILRIFKGE